MVHSANKPSILHLDQLPQAKNYYVAYSGGIDSTALLHALWSHDNIKDRIVAIHINHNINEQANAWTIHCQNFCHKHGIKLISVDVNPRSNSEDACRSARQQVYQQYVNKNDCLLTGHHQNDQAETVLFRLIRGTGIQGMTGISLLSYLHNIPIYRPMLFTSKYDINTYVTSNGLPYVTDSSNHSDQYSRNFIRNQILPLIETKFPNAIKNINLTANNIHHSAELIDSNFINLNPLHIHAENNETFLSTAIYHWLNQFNTQSPGQNKIRQFAYDCLNCGFDKSPELKLPQLHLICWKKQIHALKPHNVPSIQSFDISLHNNQKFNLPNDTGELLLSCDQTIQLNGQIRYNQTGEEILSAHNKHHVKVKKLFQKHNIPPWERKITPYLYVDNQLMAVGSHIKSLTFKKYLNAVNAEYSWISPAYLL